jgi:hypothetical protein
MAGIFISYRRDDAQGWAGRLTEDLKRSLKGVRIFRDIDAIPAGTPFAEFISEAVGSCDVLIALIGPRWLTATDETGKRRLDDPRDVTRSEISAALRYGVVVIPTLVDGARLPYPADLPEDLQPLVSRQCYHLEDRAWQDDVRRLVAVLKPLVKVRRRLRTAFISGTALLLLLALALYVAPRRSDLANSSAASADAGPAQPLQTSPSQSPQPTPPSLPSSTDRAETPARASPPIGDNSRPRVEEPSKADTRLLDSREQARDSLISAMRSRERAGQSAQAADRSAAEASRAYNVTKETFKDLTNGGIVRSIIRKVDQDATESRRASLRARNAAKTTQDAVMIAEAKVEEAARTKEPAEAVRAAEAASVAAETARTAAEDAAREAESAARFAKISEQGRDQAVELTPRVTILSASCVRKEPYLYIVELSGEAVGPPTITLSIDVSPGRPDVTFYAPETELFCTSWRSVDRSHCTSANIDSPTTHWKATVMFRPLTFDAPPVVATAHLSETRVSFAVPLECQ